MGREEIQDGGPLKKTYREQWMNGYKQRWSREMGKVQAVDETWPFLEPGLTSAQ